ncbi:MAG: ElyC/SanA/YdcF family protein [bacterium]
MTKTRTNSTQLPSYQELCDILAHEAPRPIPQERQQNHYSDFTTIRALLNSYGLPTKFFNHGINFVDLKDETIFEEVLMLFSELEKNILRTQDSSTQQSLFNNIYNYLSEADKPEQADIIFVFGSKVPLRTEKAIRLYKEGYAPRILLSGKGPFYEHYNGEKPEAEMLAQYAMDRGVPSDALILEGESITVPDNVKRSLNLVEERAIPCGRIILVNSPFSQRRGWAHFSKMSKKGTKFFRSNTDTVSKKYSMDGWYRDETGVRVIIKEFFGLMVSEMLNTS